MTEILVENIVRHYNPLKTDVWGGKVTARKVSNALKARRIAAEHGSKDHAARIAYLVENPYTTPIEIDVGVPVLNCYVEWPIVDGNHRLAAAIIRGDKTILANVSGQMDYAQELFGCDCTDYDLNELTK